MPKPFLLLSAVLTIAIVLGAWWFLAGPHTEAPAWLAWASFIWAEACGIALAWVSYLGYRQPRGNRVTAWLDDMIRWRYRRYFPSSEDAAEFSRHAMLESAVMSAGLVILFATLLLIGALK
jgi:hypothetical protein